MQYLRSMGRIFALVIIMLFSGKVFAQDEVPVLNVAQSEAVEGAFFDCRDFDN